MARTMGETKFASALGHIGERDLAPKLLAQIGITELRNVNDHRKHHVWADYLGRLNGEWVAVAVRTRVNWEKPQAGHLSPVMKRGFGNAGLAKAKSAIRIMRADLGLSASVSIRLLWLAIAVDLDNTYEAYWGDLNEMKANGETRLTVQMRAKHRLEYTRQGRCLAMNEPCVIPWEAFPEQWACSARKLLVSMPDAESEREQRIKEAILQSSKVVDRRRTIRERRVQISTRIPTGGGNPPEIHEFQLEKLLAACKNPNEVSFFRQRLGAGQPRTQKALKYVVNGVVRWYAAPFSSQARVRQKGRFIGDEEFWRSTASLSSPLSVKPLDRGRDLCFYLCTAADFESFQAIAEKHSAALPWLGSRFT